MCTWRRSSGNAERSSKQVGELYRGAKADLEGPTNVDATLALVQLPTRCIGAVCAIPRTNWNRTKPRNPTGCGRTPVSPQKLPLPVRNRREATLHSYRRSARCRGQGWRWAARMGRSAVDTPVRQSLRPISSPRALARSPAASSVPGTASQRAMDAARSPVSSDRPNLTLRYPNRRTIFPIASTIASPVLANSSLSTTTEMMEGSYRSRCSNSTASRFKPIAPRFARVS